MGQGFDDYMLTHTVEDLHAGVDVDTADIDDEIVNVLSDDYEEWKKKKEDAINTPVIGRLNLTDMGNAERLFLRQGDSLTWSSGSGWRYWDGKRWKRDIVQMVIAKATSVVRQIYAEANQTKDQERREALAKWAVRSEAAPRINAMVDLARSLKAVDDSIFDKDPWLVNFKNGTLNLQTGEFKTHDPKDFITKLIDIDYDTSATCPIWHEFLKRVIPSIDDRRFLQKAVGYSLTGSTREHCFFILHGKGNNGKSTFVNTIQKLFGDYAMSTLPDTFMEKKNDNSINNDVARLCNVRMVCSVETEDNKHLSESLVKRLTGGDIMTARFLQREFFDFEPIFKLWMAANHKPQIKGTDDGIWRRIRLIPFIVQIPDDEQIKDLKERLLLELPGIIIWVIDGAKMWLSEGLPSPKNVKEATSNYRNESDHTNSFIEDCCKKEGETNKSDLYNAYVAWAEGAKERPLTKNQFGSCMIEKGFEEQRRTKSRSWVGIRLLTLDEKIKLIEDDK